MLVLTDDELCKGGLPLPTPHLIHVIRLLLHLSFHGCEGFAARLAAGAAAGPQHHADASSNDAGHYGRFVLASCCQLLRRLFDRWSRRAFCVAEVWNCPTDAETRRAQRAVQEQGPLGKLLLSALPFAVPFPERLDLFRAWAAAEKCVGTGCVNSFICVVVPWCTQLIFIPHV